MKRRRYPKAYGSIIVILITLFILFSITFYSCRRARPVPDKTTPEQTQTTPEPETPKTTPPKSSPQKPGSPPPGKTAAPPPKEVASLPPEKTLPEEKYFTHTVKWNGETLFIIAAWYTGERDHWRAIAEVMTRENPNVNIHRIRRGDKIPVPESLMKTRDPMPKEFVDNFFQPSKPEKPPSKPAAPKEEEKEPELFGPKDPSKK
jgi:hypothetical protein